MVFLNTVYVKRKNLRLNTVWHLKKQLNQSFLSFEMSMHMLHVYAREEKYERQRRPISWGSRGMIPTKFLNLGSWKCHLLCFPQAIFSNPLGVLCNPAEWAR